jgi:hypothetical protein
LFQVKYLVSSCPAINGHQTCRKTSLSESGFRPNIALFFSCVCSSLSADNFPAHGHLLIKWHAACPMKDENCQRLWRDVSPDFWLDIRRRCRKRLGVLEWRDWLMPRDQVTEYLKTIGTAAFSLLLMASVVGIVLVHVIR